MTWKLLVADDEKHIREGVCAVIESLGLPITIVAKLRNGAEVIDFLCLQEVDIFLIDINMPKLSGLELIAQIRSKHSKDKEILILTGYDEFSFAKTALQLRVSSYLLKPVDENELKNSLKQSILRLEEKKARERQLQELKCFLAYEMSSTVQYSSLVEEALNLITKHFADVDWDLNVAAKQLSCHPDYLSKKLKQETLFSFKEQLNAMRLQTALDLLKANQLTVNEIAWRVGFSNAQYFSTVFKKYFASSPSRFYKLN